MNGTRISFLLLLFLCHRSFQLKKQDTILTWNRTSLRAKPVSYLTVLSRSFAERSHWITPPVTQHTSPHFISFFKSPTNQPTNHVLPSSSSLPSFLPSPSLPHATHNPQPTPPTLPCRRPPPIQS
ncbi:hypothetical protein BKA81DRAFT_133944 [Phyllosticta paracitricarpa]